MTLCQGVISGSLLKAGRAWIQKRCEGTWEYRQRISASPLAHPASFFCFVFFLLPPPPPPPSLPFTVWVRISKVVFQRCIVAGYYRSNTTQGTPALWVLEQLRAEEQMSPSPPLSPPIPPPLPMSLSVPNAAPVGIRLLINTHIEVGYSKICPILYPPKARSL